MCAFLQNRETRLRGSWYLGTTLTPLQIYRGLVILVSNQQRSLMKEKRLKKNYRECVQLVYLQFMNVI